MFRIKIYIPLCIYFNGLSRTHRLQSLNLHSTMYLFQRDSGILTSVVIAHLHSTMYLFQHTIHFPMSECIPFTFHYVSISTYHCLIVFLRLHIYIPLCIYFNSLSCALSTETITFTFHYVSISTSLLFSIKNF